MSGRKKGEDKVQGRGPVYKTVDWGAVEGVGAPVDTPRLCNNEASAHVPDEFGDCFHALTGHFPFPWQRDLYQRLLSDKFPGRCDIPTGLGKTFTIAVWLLALEHRSCAGTAAAFPRRLVYVVNRRTVVDQATDEAKQMRDALCNKPELQTVADTLRRLCARPSGEPLAISTLRGQFADNAEWRDDPARPAIIVGTVDMIGSRLLFNGYGCGFKSRPLHAGFLGQDTLLVHDEAHLEPAFQSLLEDIEQEQRRRGDARPLRVMALTATSRVGGDSITITDEDRKDTEVRKADWREEGAPPPSGRRR